jgi:hypothetical protein
MVADILTKALARDRHEGLSEIMGWNTMPPRKVGVLEDSNIRK